MRRVLVLAFLIGGIFLLGMTAVVGLARREAAIQWLIYVPDGNIYRLDVSSGERELLLEKTHPLNIQLSPNGRQAVVVDAPRFENVEISLVDLHTSTSHDLGEMAIFRDTNIYDSSTWHLDQSARYEVEPLRVNHGISVTSRSPDGKWIVFVGPGDMRQGTNLYIVSANGENRRRVADLAGSDWFNAWSPDNEWLIFSTDIYDQTQFIGADIFRYNLRTQHIEQLTSASGNDRFLTISSDENWIYYQNLFQGVWEIRRMRIDGSENELIVEGNLDVSSISPNGNWILLRRYGSGEYLSAVMLNTDNGEIQLLNLTPANRSRVDWSPNDEWAVFVFRFVDGSERLYALSPVSLDVRFLVEAPGFYAEEINITRFSPNGRWLLVNSSTGYADRRYQIIDMETGAINDFNAPVSYDNYYIDLWSPDSEWMIGTTYDGTASERGAQLFRVRPNGTDMQALGPPSHRYWIFGWWSVIDLDWSADLLTIIGLAAIGGSLCVGYWFSRS